MEEHLITLEAHQLVVMVYLVKVMTAQTILASIKVVEVVEPGLQLLITAELVDLE